MFDRLSTPILILAALIGMFRTQPKRRKQQQYIDMKPRSGYVYLIEVPGQNGLYKIGKTKDPNDRMKTFKLDLPIVVNYVHLIPCRDRHLAERELHERYADKRQRDPVDGSLSEFFELSSRDVRDIKAIKRM